jgi:Sensors of blue-light using FAD
VNRFIIVMLPEHEPENIRIAAVCAKMPECHANLTDSGLIREYSYVFMRVIFRLHRTTFGIRSMFNSMKTSAALPARADQMSLARIIYRSENAINVAGSRILIHYHDIVSTARRRNAESNISGFLMFDRQRYHQILEGDSETLEILYKRIAADPRHSNLETLRREPIGKRDFPDWSMGSFLSEGASHPLQAKFGIVPTQPVSADDFLKFALAFVSLEPHAG